MRLFAWVFVCLFPLAVFGQEYVEASGQTVVFELKAGAKAGWNNTVGIFMSQRANAMAPCINFTMDILGRLSFSLGNYPAAKNIILTVCNAAGAVIEKSPLADQKPLMLGRILSNGYYIARIDADGKTITNTSFVVAR
jgi:hypothetical protein